jgi:murein DD-endopeptidase MepM/ murein hydrolase activator NlpD
MSAVLPHAPLSSSFESGSIGIDGIRRYKTRCKILVDSHSASQLSKTLEIFDDIFSVDISKTIKGPGNASITLIPSQNYLNLIFPNDYINIYFDIGDGSGWTRTFFGFVDRVEESYSVEQSGKPKTLYRLICTDFVKAIEQTMIYFNPHLAGRKDFTSYDFAKMNIGGLALMSKGIVAGGSPPDVVTNILLLLIGFGTQFRLPSSYKPGDTQKRLREERAKLVYGRLNEESLKALGNTVGSYEMLRAEANADAAFTFSPYRSGVLLSEEERTKALADALGVTPETYKLDYQSKSKEEIIRLIADKKIKDKLTVDSKYRAVAGSDASSESAVVNLLDSTISEDSYLSDILDVFTFVERRAIDGYMFGQPVWQKQGNLSSILRSYSNEAMNELFFDLRPLSSSGNTSSVATKPVAGSYAVAPDDKQANINDDKTPGGITYIPALVMREYPFSTIEGVNLSNVELELKDEEGNPEKIGLLYFGALFSDRPNEPGRHVISLKNINIADIAEGRADRDASRHLDVAVISEKEVTKTVLGRSDNDHFNLFEFYSDNILGKDQIFYMRDMLPIITPIHILRNGIRVRSVTTRAARFSIEAVKNLRSRDFEKAIEAVEQPEEEAPSIVSSSSIQAPVTIGPDFVRYYNNIAQAKWGYRSKPDYNGWVFHQGIDISKRPLDTIESQYRYEPIPIKAIADGLLVIAAPIGCYTGYGNVVVIKHDFENIGIRYSVYAHLSTIDKGFGLEKQVLGTKSNRYLFAAKGAPGIGRTSKNPITINKGETIGTMGNTGFTAGANQKFHLHFEIDRLFPPKDPSTTPIISYDDWGQLRDAPPPPNGFDRSGTDTDTMKSNNQRSCDPYRFYLNGFGLNLETLINSGVDDDGSEYTGEPISIDPGDATQEDLTQVPIDQVEKETSTQLVEEPGKPLTDRSLVDTPTSRRQIIRWALLQDHWYQHNLEYLSGKIDMRGAPEIRVGYRLDMFERCMSYYVEGVNHTWSFPNNMVTSLAVSRGQPNCPFPVYVYPSYSQMGAPESQRRTSKSRLATYFVTPDPVAIRRSLFLRGGKSVEAGQRTGLGSTGENVVNTTDSHLYIDLDTDTYISSKYNERISPAGSREVTKAMEDREDSIEGLTIPDDKSKLDPVTGPDSTRGINKEDVLENK